MICINTISFIFSLETLIFLASNSSFIRLLYGSPQRIIPTRIMCYLYLLDLCEKINSNVQTMILAGYLCVDEDLYMLLQTKKQTHTEDMTW